MANEEQSPGGKLPEEPQVETRAEGTHGIGALLRASRMRCGEDLRYVSDMLHIRYLYLEAIEDDRFQDLPGPTYVVGFIRAYADHLGLDSDEVVRRLKIETSGFNGRSELDFPIPIQESVVPGRAILFVGIVIAVLAYGGWYVSSPHNGAVSELTSPLPSRFRKLLPKVQPAPPNSENTGMASAVVSKADKPVTTENVGKEVKQGIIQDTSSKTPAAISPAQPVPAKKQDVKKADVSTGDASGNGGGGPVSGATEKNKTANKTANKTSGHNDSGRNNVADTGSPKPSSTPSPIVIPKKHPTGGADIASTTVEKPVVAKSVSKPQPKKIEVPNTSPSKPSEGDTSLTKAKSAKDAPTKAKSAKAAPTKTKSTKAAPVKVTSSSHVSNVAVAGIATGRTYGLENKDSRITVVAKTDSWIQVRDDVADQLLLTRLLRSGDKYRVPNRPGLKLLTGNAGALDILVDGKLAPSIGSSGVVRRGVILDVKRLRNGTAVAKR